MIFLSLSKYRNKTLKKKIKRDIIILQRNESDDIIYRIMTKMEKEFHLVT